MISLLQNWDLSVFYWINNGWSHPALDVFFRVVTSAKTYVLPGAGVAAYLWFKGGARGRTTLLALALCVGMTDVLSSRVIKPLVARPRPCVALPHVLTPDSPRRTFSFPSGHATNIAGAALVLSLEYRLLIFPSLLTAFLVGLSRVYLGVHYPSDILGGFMIGALLGFGALRLARRIRK